MTAGSRKVTANSTVYQLYPRSYRDANGDGIGDIAGMTRRMDHIANLGVDALLVAPLFPSPNADFGYDVTDYCDISPTYGSLMDFDEMVQVAHARGLGVVVDMVPCHTSIEHPWFRDHPEWYIWSDVDGPANNWVACFGGKAWSRDEQSGKWYLHSYYPEQPDLNWRNPEVVEAMTDVFSFWHKRGVDGFRLDAVSRLVKDAGLRDNPPLTNPFPLWENALQAMWDQRRYHLDQPDTFPALARLKEELDGTYLIAEAYLPNRDLAPYLEHVDAAFTFELLQSSPCPHRLARILKESASLQGLAWTLANHDFGWITGRWGHEMARLAALLVLTLPGGAYLYQGEEIGMTNAPPPRTSQDRAGRDPFRHPLQWTRDGGFSSVEPWIPYHDPVACNVEDQDKDPGSLLSFYRALLTLRPALAGPLDEITVDESCLSYRRGAHRICLNFGDSPVSLPPHHEVILTTGDATIRTTLGPHSGAILAL